MSTENQSELRHLGAAIREHRKQLGKSQGDFAELCELHRTYIGQVERGEKNLSFVNLSRIAKALKISPSALLASAGL